MRVTLRTCLSLMAIALLAQSASAQTVTVQQPVAQQFGVNTVVSVPDRGSVLLGSVSSARSFGGSRGPALPSSSLTRSVNHSWARVSVFIHDHEAMDRRLLAAAEAQSSSERGSTLSGMAAHARQSLLKRHAHSRRLHP